MNICPNCEDRDGCEDPRDDVAEQLACWRDGYKKYVDRYLKAQKEVPFKSYDDVETLAGKQEAIRYCLVCGLMPVTKQSLRLLGDKDFYISAERLPTPLVKATIKKADEVFMGWEFIEEYEIKETESGDTTLAGVWIKGGRIRQAKVERVRTVVVETTYASQKLDTNLMAALDAIEEQKSHDISDQDLQEAIEDS